MIQSKVFIIQDDGSRDFSDARRFGQLVPLVERDIFADDAEERSAKVAAIIDAKLRDFLPKFDYILLTGDPAAIISVGLWLGYAYGGQAVRVLKWDKENHGYYAIEV